MTESVAAATDPLWAALLLIPGIGSVRLARLMQCFESPEAVLSAGEKTLLAVPGLGESAAGSLLRADRERLRQSAAEEERKASESGARILSLRHPEYPAALREVPAPPAILYVRGSLQPEDAISVSMVGTRHASRYGLQMAREIARGLAEKGVTIISGLARGVDTEAHIGALEAGGRTIGVLGCGVDVCYPGENRKLYREIQKRGAIVSEFPMAAPPVAENFPKRNRIISGLCLATLVVEAPRKSGALITARRALEQGRDVLALPGRASETSAEGTNRLIRDGATLVTSAADILDELQEKIEAMRAALQNGGIHKPLSDAQTEMPQPDMDLLSRLGAEVASAPVAAETDKAATLSLTGDERTIYDTLQKESAHIDSIVRTTGFPASKASRILLMLEMRGLVIRNPGMTFSRA